MSNNKLIEKCNLPPPPISEYNFPFTFMMENINPLIYACFFV